MKKIVIAAFVVGSVALFFSLGLDQQLTLANGQASQQQLDIWHQNNPLLSASVFILVYIAVTALSLPGAAFMTLVAGAIFGLWWGVFLVSFASSIGATLAFLVSRLLFRQSVQHRFAAHLKTINDGIEREGAFYLFALRLVPLFPFFMTNLLMGLTPIRTFTFYWVSQLGMLAGTVVYVNAGTQLAKIDSLSSVFSPALLVSFALLGVFPILAKKILATAQKRKVYDPWIKPKSFDRNLVVIGAGAAGLVSAYMAAVVKAKVTLVEAHKMGGDCLNYGCVPSKALIKSAKVAQLMRNAADYGLEAVEPKFSFAKVMSRVHKIILAIESHDSVARYTELGVDVLKGHAKLVDPWTVEIQLNDGSHQRLTTRSIIIAAGAQPFVPPIAGMQEMGYLTTDTLWSELAQRDDPPEQVVVLGGGPIGCELAQAFARLGSQVTLIEMLPKILIREDQEVSEFAAQTLQKDGVSLLTSHKALRCEQQGAQKIIVVEHDGQESPLEFDELICAVGRAPSLSGYGLETLGIPTQQTVLTNEYLETLYPNIFAAGDVVGPYQFTHTAAHQAWYATVNALFGRFKKFKVDYSVIPWATFIDPEVARVGLNEQQAQQEGVAYEVTRYGIDDLDRAIADGTAEGFVKVLTVPGKDKILGVTIVGSHAADLLAEFVLAMKHNIGLNKLLGTIHIYPTLAEANKYAAGEWKRAHAPEGLLRWVERFHTFRRR